MKLSKPFNRILGALLLALAVGIAYYNDGLWVNFSSGLLAGAGVLLLIKGKLRPERK